MSYGDKIIVSGKGGDSPRLWCFIDENNNIVSVSRINESVENVTLVTPLNAVKLIINTLTSDKCYYGIKIKDKTDVHTDSIGNIWKDDMSKQKWLEKYKENPDCILSIEQTDIGYFTTSLKYSTLGVSNVSHPIPYDMSLYLEIDKPENSFNVLFGFGYLREDGAFIPQSIRSSTDDVKNNLEVFRLRDNLNTEGLYVVVGINTSDFNTKLQDYVRIHRVNPYTSLKFLQLTSIYNIQSSQDAFKHGEEGDRHIVYYFPRDMSSVRWSDTTYFYGGGQCLDVVFYDRDRNIIDGYPIVGTLDSEGKYLPPVSGGNYPLSIKIPKKAVYYRIALYGLRSGKNTFINLSYMLPNSLSRFGIYCYNSIQYTKSYYAGLAVKNATKLARLSYDVNYYNSSKYFLIYPKYDNNIKTTRRAKGLLYGNFYQLNYGVSWYTYLSLMRAGTGVCVYSFKTANAPIGVHCVGFGSILTGINMQYSVHNFLEKYKDKMECLTNETVIEPGDILLETRYRYCKCIYNDQIFVQYENNLLDRNTWIKYGDYIYQILGEESSVTGSDPAKGESDFDLIRVAYTKTDKTPNKLHLCEYLKDSFRNFNYSSDTSIDYNKNYYTVTSPDRYTTMTHFALVVALNSDPISGKLIGHTRIESSNTWTRIWTPSNHTEKWYWRVPAKYITDTKKCDNNYTFDIDKQLDTLNNIDNISFPPIVSSFGDMAIIGNPVPYPAQLEREVKWRNASFTLFRDSRAYRFYVEKGYTKITVKKDGNIIGKDIPMNSLLNYTENTEIGSMNYFDLFKDELSEQTFYIEEPGEYEIYVGTENETYPYSNIMCGKYLLPAVPAVHVYQDFKTIELEGNLNIWDKFYFRLMPKPIVLPGFPYKTPWCNYMFVDGDNFEDSEMSTETRKVYKFGDEYVWCIELRVTSLKYGQLICSIRNPFVSTDEFINGLAPLPDDEDETDQDTDPGMGT